MLQIYHISSLCPGILIKKYSYYIVGALRRRCFPEGETTGRISSARQRNKFLSRTVTHPLGPQCCEYSTFRHFYRRILFTNIRYCIVGALRRRCFPCGETTGRMISAPTWRTPPNFRSVFSGTDHVGVVPPNHPADISQARIRASLDIRAFQDHPQGTR